MFDKKHSFIIQCLAFILGFTSIVSQVVILRELIVVFYGNETAYAIILASWLFWVAVGSFISSLFITRIKKPKLFLGSLLVAVYIILPLTVLDIRFVKEIMNLGAGEIMGIFPMCISSFLLLAPLAVVLGSIFTLTCRLGELESPEESVLSVGRVYCWESFGAVVGGIAFSVFLIHLLSAVQIVFFVGLINIILMTFLLGSKRIFAKLGMVILSVTLLAYLLGWIDAFDRYMRKIQWKNFDIVAIADSIYGNITLTERLGEYALFENGLLSFSSRDALGREEVVHYPMLQHPHPQEVLLIGNGLGGVLAEILKHPVRRIDYIELDPKVIELSARYLPAEVLIGVDDKRVNVVHTDARLFVKQSDEKYDVILVNCGDPLTAMINRYYSLEFFTEARRILKPQGILSLSVSSSENYISRETKAFLMSIHTTLKRVFPDVKSIPGDTNIFIANTNKGVLTYNPDILTERLQKRDIQTKYVRDYYLVSKLSKDRVEYIEQVFKDEGMLNTDMHPTTYFYNIVACSTRFNLNFQRIIKKISWIKLRHLMVIPILLLLCGLGLRRLFRALPVTTSIITTGFSEIIFQIVVILSFQTLYGFAYYRIGLIMASFMGGIGLGSFFARKIIIRLSQHTKSLFSIYRWTQVLICLYPVMLPFIFVFFRDRANLQYTGFFSITFAILPVIAGFIGGLQYPLATHLLTLINKAQSPVGSQKGGMLYAADTLGATIGALLTGALLIPLLGIRDVVFFCAAINAAVLILLMIPVYPASLSVRE